MSLTRENGTFAQCNAASGEHALNKTWPSQEPPPGMFVDERMIRPRSAAVLADDEY